MSISVDAINRGRVQDLVGGMGVGAITGVVITSVSFPPIAIGISIGTTIGMLVGDRVNAVYAKLRIRSLQEAGDAALSQGRNDLAKLHFENAATFGSTNARWKVGLLHEQSGNIPLAAKCYQMALEQLSPRGEMLPPYTPARDALQRLLNAPGVSAEDCVEIGKMYHNGTDVQPNYQNAEAWYQRACVIDPRHQRATHNIGVLCENGQYYSKHVVIAARYYQKSYFDLNFEFAKTTLTRLLNNPTLSKNERKIIEKETLIRYWEKGENALLGYLRTSDNSQNQISPVKRAIEYKQYKLAARLQACFYHRLSERMEITNDAERIKIMALQDQLTKLIRGLRKPAPEVFFKAMNVTDRNRAPHIFSMELFTELYDNIPLLQPIFELVKLMKLGHHKLSGREKYIVSGYDSEDDDVKDRISFQQHLKFNIDWASTVVESLYIMPGYDRAGGVSLAQQDERIRNTVTVGAKIHDNTPEDKIPQACRNVRGLLFHELTHFVTSEVFENGARPYRNGDDRMKTKYKRMVDELNLLQQDPEYELDERIKNTFTHPIYNYPNDPVKTEFCHHQELIVRVPEILVRYGNDAGLALLEAQAPNLLKFYRKYFLPAVNARIEQNLRVAVGGLPLEMLMREMRTNGR